MTGLSFGDAAARMQLQRLGTALRAEVPRLSQELTTGRSASPGQALRGDMAPVAMLNAQIAAADTTRTATSESALHVGMMQQAVGEMARSASDHAVRLLQSSIHDTDPALTSTAATARDGFRDIVALLNTTVAGRSLFAGTRTDSAAVIDSDAMLQALVDDIVSSGSAEPLAAQVQDWFAQGGGFDTVGYLGNSQPVIDRRFDGGERVRVDVSADTDALRASLAAFAIGALATTQELGADPGTRRGLIAASGEARLGAADKVISVAARLGQAEQLIETARTAAAARAHALTLARDSLIEADPFAAASRLEQVLGQLDSIYMVTARAARMSLTDYLR